MAKMYDLKGNLYFPCKNTTQTFRFWSIFLLFLQGSFYMSCFVNLTLCATTEGQRWKLKEETR